MSTNIGRLRAIDVPEIPVPDDLSGYELVDGQLVPIMPSKRRHSWLAVELIVRFRAHVDRVKTGVVYGDVWCWLKVPYDPECLRAPDVAYFSHAKLAEAGEGDIFPCPPDLVVEIFSPSNRKRPGDFQRRVRDYLDAGTPLLWVIYPDARYAMMHRPDGSARMIREMGSLDGEEVLPGFTIQLGELFSGMP
jgi:Uma2 family endonuclease